MSLIKKTIKIGAQQIIDETTVYLSLKNLN